MPWGALAATLVSAGVSILGGKQASDVAGAAAERESAASAQALAAQEGAYQEAKGALQPYALQEQVASTQMMAQMGLAPPGGGAPTGAPTGGVPTGGDAWGFGADVAGQAGNMNKFIEDVLTEQMVIAKRGGYNKKRGLAEGARRTTELIDQLKAQGKLPQSFQLPSMSELTQQAGQIEDTYGGLTKMAKTLSPGVTGEGYGPGNLQGFVDKYQVGGAPAGKPGAPRGEMGAQPTGGPTPQTAADIMGRAGVEGLPEGLGEQYYAGIMEDPRTDPELAAYLGLTPESMQVGAGYQELPAYMRAREAGIETVNTGAAGAGQLYSGRRGEALRDVGQQVESQYYQEAVRQREGMMGARRGERGAGLARMGGAYETGRNREQSYYNNYMQLLQSMSQPTSTTNLASMGTAMGKETAANITGTARNVSDLQIGGAGAQQAAYADVAGGLMRMGAAYI